MRNEEKMDENKTYESNGKADGPNTDQVQPTVDPRKQ